MAGGPKKKAGQSLCSGQLLDVELPGIEPVSPLRTTCGRGIETL
jgi:hypothetical protein